MTEQAKAMYARFLEDQEHASAAQKARLTALRGRPLGTVQTALADLVFGAGARWAVRYLGALPAAAAETILSVARERLRQQEEAMKERVH